jgi:hypothetical protein
LYEEKVQKDPWRFLPEQEGVQRLFHTFCFGNRKATLDTREGGDPDLYPNNFKNRIFGGAKAPKFADHK